MSIQQSLALDFSLCQRWNGGRERYRPAGEVFDHRHATVERIDTATAKAFVRQHHYSGSFPASRLNAGLSIRRPFQKEVLAGVATFSVPMSQNVIPALLDGLDPSLGVELGRLVLLDSVEANERGLSKLRNGESGTSWAWLRCCRVSGFTNSFDRR